MQSELPLVVSRITPTILLWLVFILVSSIHVTAAFDSVQVRTVSIKKARGISTGQSVRIAGTVTAQSGAFASSISSGFALQDASAGIYVVDADHSFKLGDRVEITGTRGEEYGQSTIILESAKKLTGSSMVMAGLVRSGDVGEAQEGILVRIEGYVTRTEGDPPYGHKVFIDDSTGEIQIFVNESTGLVDNARDWKARDFVSVIGVVGQYEESYEIMPRILSDFTLRAAE